MSLTPEEKNSAMGAERAFLKTLLESAVDGDFERLKSCVDEYCLKNEGVSASEVLTQFKDGKKRTALHFACQSTPSQRYARDIAEDMLLSKWLPSTSIQTMLRLKDNDGLTPLMLAAQVTDEDLAEKRVLTLLQADSDTAKSSDAENSSKLGLARSHAGATPLHYAAGAGASAKAIKAIYDAGQVAVNTCSLQGGTPLHWACATPPPKDYTDTISALLDCGADPNIHKVEDSQMIPPPLVLALAAGNDCHAKYLLKEAEKRGIDLGPTLAFTLPGRLSPYHVAADMNMVGTLALLLEKVPKDTVLQMKTTDGLSPLDIAAREGHVGCVLLLLPGDKQTEEEAERYIENAKSKRRADEKSPSISMEKGAPPSNEKDESPDLIETKAKSVAASIVATASEVSEESKKKAQELKTTGNCLFEKKEWEAAIGCYTEAISCDPTDATFYSNRSACYVNLNEPENALYDAVITRCLRPDWPKAAYRMAVARLDLGRYEDAALSAWEGLQQDQENEELKRLLQKCVKKGRQDFLGSKEE